MGYHHSLPLAGVSPLVLPGGGCRPPLADPEDLMPQPSDVLCAGIIVADHVCTPITHLPAAGELVLADQLLLTIGGCAANVAVDLVKMGRQRVGGWPRRR